MLELHDVSEKKTKRFPLKYYYYDNYCYCCQDRESKELNLFPRDGKHEITFWLYFRQHTFIKTEAGVN